MAYQIVAIPMTLNDLQGHAPNVGILKYDFLYSYAAVDNILSDIALSALCSPSVILSAI